MRLIDKFHKMEMEFSLFEIGKDESYPIWDIIRYQVYREYYYTKEDAHRFFVPKKRNKLDYFYLLKNFFKFLFILLFKKADILILSSSRYRNISNQFYDKSALPIIDIAGKKGLVFEAIMRKRLAYPYVYDFNNIFSRFYKSKPIANGDFKIIENALINCLGECKITFAGINQILHDYQSDVIYYRKIFKKLGIKKLFIIPGNPKATITVAKELEIQTYLVQHAGIEFDEVDYSYPLELTASNQILFSDYLLTLGDYWCKNLNVPTRIISVGNDCFYAKPLVKSNNSLLVVSTIVHGIELRTLTKDFSRIAPDVKIFFKLHPNEFHYVDDYTSYFADCKNVQVVTVEEDTNKLIAKAELVVLIVSAVVYEALNQNKKVAIFKRINYERQLVLSELKNVYFIDGADELSEVLGRPTIKAEVNFYKPTDLNVLTDLIVQ